MNAIILAAGLGSRLRPLTDNTPKALVPVAGKPMIEHLILKMKRCGITHIVVNVHYLGEQIIDFLKANQNFGLHIEVSDERGKLLDTGGGVRRALTFFDGEEAVMVHNVDVFCNLDFVTMMQAAESECDDVLLLAAPRATSRMIYFDGNNRLAGWKNLKTGEMLAARDGFEVNGCSALAFDGVHLMAPSMIKRMMNDKAADVPFPLIPYYLSVASECRIGSFIPVKGFEWVDAGKPEALEAAAAIVERCY